MANGDTLADLLALVRAEMPEIPDAVWRRVAEIAGANYGGSRVYVRSEKKRRHLETLAAMDDHEDLRKIAAKLGVSVRHARRYKNLG